MAKKKRELKTSDTWIYLIRDEDTKLIKIGRSGDPARRLNDLTRQGTLLPKPFSFTLLYTWRMTNDHELSLHNHFGHKRVRGEWFALTEQDITDIYEWFDCCERRVYVNDRNTEEEDIVWKHDWQASSVDMAMEWGLL